MRACCRDRRVTSRHTAGPRPAASVGRPSAGGRSAGLSSVVLIASVVAESRISGGPEIEPANLAWALDLKDLRCLFGESLAEAAGLTRPCFKPSEHVAWHQQALSYPHYEVRDHSSEGFRGSEREFRAVIRLNLVIRQPIVLD